MKRARLMLGLVAFGLAVSGLTVFPARAGIRWLMGVAGGGLRAWLGTCLEGLDVVSLRYPSLLYAGDWLAFAHLMLAVLFLGAMRDPVRNLWVVQFGLVSCAAIVPFALVLGPLRGIPPAWTAVDCAFAPAAGIPLWIAYREIRKEEGRT